jgi:hypothetical protein
MCLRQCKQIEKPIDKSSSYEGCINPPDQDNSYNYCDKLYQFDYFKKNQCKNDMCKLCCVSMDQNKKIILPNISDELFTKCESECVKSKYLLI